jgi:hypothetical protein
MARALSVMARAFSLVARTLSVMARLDRAIRCRADLARSDRRCLFIGRRTAKRNDPRIGSTTFHPRASAVDSL